MLEDNQISDINVLAKNRKLKLLNLKGNHISNIDSLSNLTALENLDLSENNISNIDSLQNLLSLEHLFLSSNQISDISALISLIENVDHISIGLRNNYIPEESINEVIRDDVYIFDGTNQYNAKTYNNESRY